MRLHLLNQTGGPYESRNVVAEIKGRERPDEIVVLGAHLDSWDLGTGAERHPRARAASAPHHPVRAVHRRGARHVRQRRLRTASQSGNGPAQCGRDFRYRQRSHHRLFLKWMGRFAAAANRALANQDAAPYLPQYHAESDTVDRVSTRELRANSAIPNSVVWWLAEDPDRFGHTDTRLDAQMKAFGQWDDYRAVR